MITRFAKQREEEEQEKEEQDREEREFAENNPVRRNTRKKKLTIPLSLTILNTRNKPCTVPVKDLDHLLTVNKNSASDELSLFTVFSQILSGNNTMRP